MAEVVAVTGLGMVTLRGDLGTLAAAADLPVPETRMSTRRDGQALLWMSPDELLLVCDDAPGRAALLRERLVGRLATVADVSDARAVFDVKGPDAAATLAKLMPVDFAGMAATEVRRSRLAQVPAACWHEDAGVRVVCFRSVADYVRAALENAAASAPPPLYGS